MAKTTDKTKLGALCLASGKPVYKIAADVDIAFTQLSRYINLHERIKNHHLRALSAYFHVEPEELIGLVDASEPGGGAAASDGRAAGAVSRPDAGALSGGGKGRGYL